MRLNFLHVLSITTVLLVAGCARTGQPTTKPSYNYSPAIRTVSIPPVDVSQTIFVGDKIMNKAVRKEIDALKTVDAQLDEYSSVRAGVAHKVGEDSKHIWYKQIGELIYSHKFDFSDYSIMVRKSDGAFCKASAWREWCYPGIQYEKTTDVIFSDTNFVQTLLYLGSPSENRIKIGYREFSGDMARPAFSNDVEYDLSRGNTVSYKGAAIEVIKATPSELVYKVKINFPNI